MLKRVVQVFVLLLIIFPLVLWFFWKIAPETKMRIFILDKTVLTKEGLEHRSFNWILSNMKIVKDDGTPYSVAEDYYGFFPLEDYQFEIHDLEDKTNAELDSMANYYEMAYYTDTYGIYHNEWYRRGDDKERSDIIYGGLHKNDFYLLKKFVEKKKTLITEFSLFALPTSFSLRRECENLMDIRWTGWVGRFFSSLDTAKNKELPKWVSRLYKRQHNGKWPFKESGIAMVNTNDQIVVLEEKRHLQFPVPIIYTPPKFQAKYGLPESIMYPFWFSITENVGNNNVMSIFSIKTNEKGDSILKYYRIPKNFFAAIEHLSGDSSYFYFTGDFCDNQIGMLSSKLKGVRNMRGLFYAQLEMENRKRFFWEYYIPLMKNIIEGHQKRTSRRAR